MASSTVPSPSRDRAASDQGPSHPKVLTGSSLHGGPQWTFNRPPRTCRNLCCSGYAVYVPSWHVTDSDVPLLTERCTAGVTPASTRTRDRVTGRFPGVWSAPVVASSLRHQRGVLSLWCLRLTSKSTSAQSVHACACGQKDHLRTPGGSLPEPLRPTRRPVAAAQRTGGHRRVTTRKTMGDLATRRGAGDPETRAEWKPVSRYGHLRSAPVVVDVGFTHGVGTAYAPCSPVGLHAPDMGASSMLPASPATLKRVCVATGYVWLRSPREGQKFRERCRQAQTRPRSKERDESLGYPEVRGRGLTRSLAAVRLLRSCAGSRGEPPRLPCNAHFRTRTWDFYLSPCLRAAGEMLGPVWISSLRLFVFAA